MYLPLALPEFSPDRAFPAPIRSFTRRYAARLLTAMLPALLLLGAGGAYAATLTVNTTADSSDAAGSCGSGTCSLRDAISQSSSGDTINFSVTGTITLTSALPSIEQDVTISGPGANQLTVSGASSYQVFQVGTISTPTVSISGITIADGNGSASGGGAIALYSGSTLTVSNVTFAGNSGAGGGAMITDGTLTVASSTFSNNTAPGGESGGGIYIDSGTTQVVNSTFTGNSADYAGGGIDISTGTLTVTNSTFVGNSAPHGGGIIALSSSTATVNNSIFSGNEGGPSIYSNGTTNANYNVFYNNAGGDCALCTTNDNAISGDPKLLPLGYYGGTTETYLPLPGSAAICAGSAGDDASITTDQRGFAVSPSYGSCGSGSVDAGAVQTNYITVQSSGDSGGGSGACQGVTCNLRDAVALANAHGYGDIDFASGVSSITLGSGLSLSGSTGINIIGPGANQLTVNGGGSGSDFSVITVNSGDTATLYGLTITGGYATGSNGGGITSNGTLSVLNSAVSGNTAYFGGGIFSAGPLMMVADSTISGNTAYGNGGGIISSGIVLTVTNSTISGNTAAAGAGGGCGGGIDNNATLTVESSTISGNSALGVSPGVGIGGGICNAGTLSVTNSIVSGNVNGTSTEDDISDGTSAGDLDSTFTGGGNVVGDTAGAIQLAPLGLNGIGATVQTMIPLPGSPAICAGTKANIPSGYTTDERGFPNTNTTYSGYSSGTPCVDSGAVQTNYTSIAFVQQPTDTPVNTAISPSPAVEVVETNTSTGATDTVAGVPVTLDYSGGAIELSGGAGSLTTTSASTNIGGKNVNAAVYSLTPVTAGSSFTLSLGSNGNGIEVVSGTTFTEGSNSFDVYGPAASLDVSATSPITAGGPDTVMVTAVDSNGSTVLNNTDSISLTANGAPVGTITLSHGTAITSVTLTTAGLITIGAQDKLNVGVSGNTQVTVNAAAPARVMVTGGSGQSAYVNLAFGTALSATVTDAFGNAVSGVMVNFTAPSSGASAALSAPSCVTAANGACSVTATANGTAGSYNVTASVSGLTGVKFALTNNPIANLVVTVTGDDPGKASNCTAQSSPTSGTDASCSLRDALLEAASLGTANVSFDATKFATPQTITLTNGALTVPTQTAIAGPGVSLVTVSGNNASRVFSVSSGVTASISGMTIADGRDNSNVKGGGGIYNGGTLRLSTCTVSGNQQTNSGFGGGIYNDSGGSLTIKQCTISTNTAAGTVSAGAGLFNAGTVMITNSTFSANTAVGGGASGGEGGAIWNVQKATLTLIDSTLTGNQVTDPDGSGDAQGGAIFNNGAIAIENSTIAGNSQTGNGPGDVGGGIVTGGAAALSNTILAGNADTGGTPDGVGPFTDGGSNLIGNGTGITGISNGVNGDQIGTSSSPLNAKLSALGNYGGPTQTMILLPGSAAICAGSTALVPVGTTTDQRGVAFHAGGYCPAGSVDAGAVQTDYALRFSTNPAATEVSGVAFPAAVTLTESGSAFTLASESIPVTLSSGATLAGSPVLASTSNGVASYSLIVTNPTAVSGLTLTAGLTLNSSAAISAASSSFALAEPVATSLTPTVTPSSTFVYNQEPTTISVALSPSNAAGITAGDFTATLDGSTSLTVTAGSGSNVYDIALPATPLTVGAHSIAVNFTGAPGYLTSNTTISLTVTAPSYVVNTTTDDATGTAANCTSSPEGTCTLRDALAAAGAAGGANITFDATVFSASNTAAQNTITLTSGSTLAVPSNTTVSGATSGSGVTLENLVTVAGQGPASGFSVFTAAGPSKTAELDNLNITRGSGGEGGGVMVGDASQLTLNHCNVTGNTAQVGGGIYNLSTLVVKNSTVSGNTANNPGAGGGFGGGIYSDPAATSLTVIDSTISGNRALGSTVALGGGILIGNPATVTGSTIAGNTVSGGSGAHYQGGGILVGGSTARLQLANSVVAGNVSSGSYADISLYTSPGPAGTLIDDGGNAYGTASSGTSQVSSDLSPLANYGGPTQTMIPLPGSAAICAGLKANIPSGVTTDQRGEPNTNVTYAGYSAGTPCVDAGAVQTNYSMKFVQQPSTVVQNAAMTPAPTVELDESGSAFADGADTITISLALTAGTGTLTGGSASTSATTGIATYSALRISLPGADDQLTASLALNPAITPTGPAISALSGNFNVNSAVTQLAFSTAPSSTITAGGNAGSSVTVHEEDVSGALVTTAGGTITLTVTGPSSYAKTYTSAAVNGVATFDLSSAPLTTAGSYTYTAAISGNPAVTAATATITVTAASAATVSVVSGSNQSAVIGAAFASALAVKVVDQYGNVTPGATVIFTAPSIGASATFSTPATTAADGTTSVTATANGTASNTAYTVTAGVSGATTSASFTLTNTKHSTTVTVMPSSTSLVYGQPVTVTATISPASVLTSKPSGAVTFYDGAMALTPAGSVDTSTAQASYAVAVPTVGNHLYAAQYSGDTNFQQSAQTSAAQTLVVSKASSTLTGPTSAVSFTYGSGGTISVSIAGQYSGSGIATPSGTLSYTIGSGAAQTATIGGGAATLIIPAAQAAASYNISVSYAGDGNYNAATTISVPLTIKQATATIAVMPYSVTYDAAAHTATGTATGVGGANLAADLNLTATTHTAAGTYAADAWSFHDLNGNYADAGGTVSDRIGVATLVVTASNSSKIYGTVNPTFTGTVTGQQGSDTFTESFTTTATQSSNAGRYSIVPAVAGANLADYSQAVTDGTLTITQAASSTAMATSSTSITPGQSVTLTATVTSSTTGTPTGMVSFYDSGTLVSSVALSGGIATYATASLAPGMTHSFTAAYSGNVNFTPSSSTATAASSVTVAPLDFTMNLSAPANLTVVPGQSVSFQVKVTPDYGSYAGTVNFAMSGLPVGATVTFSPASIPANGGPQTVTVTIQIAPATAMLHRENPRSAPGRKLAPFALAFLLLFGVGGLRKSGRKLRGLLCVLALAGGALLAMGTSGCAGHPGFFAQSPQNYTVTVTATSANLQHSATINLNVQ
jgi:CSLREA domain-containing protein